MGILLYMFQGLMPVLTLGALVWIKMKSIQRKLKESEERLIFLEMAIQVASEEPAKENPQEEETTLCVADFPEAVALRRRRR